MKYETNVHVQCRLLHIHLHPHVALTRKRNGQILGTFQKAMLFEYWEWGGLLDIEVVPLVFRGLKVKQRALTM